MTTTNDAAQPVLTDEEILEAMIYGQSDARMIQNGRAIESAVLSRLRAPVADDYETVLADHRRLVRELDVLLNGDGAAAQASLCDIVAQVEREGIKASAPVAGEAVQLLRSIREQDYLSDTMRHRIDRLLTYGASHASDVAGEAQPFAVLAVHKNGGIRSYCTGPALADAPIQESEREQLRKHGCELVTVYAAPQASANARNLPHIRQPLTLAQIEAEYASHDYSAELLLQHALLLLRQSRTCAATDNIDVLGILREYGDHHIEHGRISFDKWTLAEAGEALLHRAALDAHKEQS